MDDQVKKQTYIYVRVYKVLYTADIKNQQINTNILVDNFWIPFKPHLKTLSLRLVSGT